MKQEPGASVQVRVDSLGKIFENKDDILGTLV